MTRMLAGYSVTILLALLLVAIGGQARSVSAGTNPGQLLGQIERPVGCFGDRGGVGAALSGTSIFYTCQASSGLSQSSLLYTTNLDGSPLHQLPVRDANDHLLPMHAIAWDSTEELVWGVDQIPTGPTPYDAICAVWRIDVNHVVGGLGEEAYPAMLAFTFSDSKLCRLNLKDRFITGLAVDGTTNTVYVSGQGGSHIRAFTKAGEPAPNDPINFAKLTKIHCPGGCRTSGLAIGADGLLMASAKLDARLFVIDPLGPTLENVITSGSSRNWGLECGPIVYDSTSAPFRTMLAADLYSQFIRVLEAPDGFCNPIDFAMRNWQISPNPLAVGQGGIGIIRLAYEAAAFGITPEVPQLTGTATWSARLERFDPTVRLLAEPGDICRLIIDDAIPVNEAVKCAEGDTAGAASIQGFAACYDGIDNDGDLLADFEDPDCTGAISYIGAPLMLSETFQNITRYAVVAGCQTQADVLFEARLAHALDTNSSNNGDNQLLGYFSAC